MKNAILAAGLLAFASSAAFAQSPAPSAPPASSAPAPAHAAPDQPRPQMQMAAPQFNPDAVRASDAARLTALKGDLKLTPDQEKKWTAAEAALQRFYSTRLDTVVRMRERKPPADAMAAAEERVEGLQAMGASMRALVDGIKPLYAALDDEQKGRLMAAAGLQAQPRPALQPQPPVQPPAPQPAPPQPAKK